MNRYCAVLLVVVLSLGGASGATAAAEVSQQIWLDYNASHWLSSKIDLYGDVGVRREFAHGWWWRLVVRPGVSVPVGNFRLTAGIGNFFIFPEVIANRWEIRPFQGVAVVWPKGRFVLHHYLRLEESFNFNTETWNSFNSLRLRYLLQASYRWPANQGDSYWQATASVEPFLVLASEIELVREHVRAAVGIERSLGHNRRLKLEVTWQQANLVFLPGEQIRDIFFRVRWYRRW